jgi:hypothetical protein
MEITRMAADTGSRSAVYDRIVVIYCFQEAVMARTPGARNRTARELEAEAKRLQQRAKDMKRIEALKKELEQAKSKLKGGSR